MFKFLNGITKKKILVVGLSVVLGAVMALSGVTVTDRVAPESDSLFQVGMGQKVITIGTVAYAAGTVDYTADGVADDVQIQAALDALPVAGGKVTMLTGTYVLAAAINMGGNQTLEGIGRDSVTFDSSALAVSTINMNDSTTVKGITISGGSVSGVEVSSDNDVRILGMGFDTIQDGVNGWAAAIHMTGTTTYNIFVDDFYIFDSDRGIEIEDGVSRVWVSNGYVDTVPAAGASPLYSIGAHTHGGQGTTRDIYYDNIYITNSKGIGAYEGGAVNDRVLNIHFSNITIMSPNTTAVVSIITAPYSSLTDSYVEGNNLDNAVDFQVGTTQGLVVIDGVTFAEIHGYYAVQQLAGTVSISNSTFRAAETANNANYAIETADPSVLILDKVNILGNYDSYAISERSTLYMTNSIVDTDTVWFRATATGSKLFYNNLAGGVLNDGGAIVGRGNTGYVTENSGTATILNGNISVTVNHGLSTNATSVLLTGTHAEVRDSIVTNITSTQFTITATANVTANRDVYWRAVLGVGN